MPILSDLAFDDSANLKTLGSVWDDLQALPSLVRSFEPDALYGATIASGTISRVNSGKTSAIYLTQPTANMQPASLTNDNFNNQPVADFDGANDQFQYSAVLDLSKAHTLAFLFRTDNPTITAQVLFGSFVDSTHGEFLQLVGSTQQMQFQSGNRVLSAALNGGYNLAICASDGAGLIKLWANGIYQEAQPGGNNQAPSTVQPSVGALNSSGASPFDGQLAWMAEFSADIFTSEPTALRLIREQAKYAYGVSF